MASEPTVDIVVAIDLLKGRVEPFFKGDWGLPEIWQCISTLVREAEIIYGAGKGRDKHALVRSVWREVNVKYNLINKLDDKIKLPFWLEPFDSKVISLMIDVIISGVVTIFNKFGWNW